jgi:dsRNA-specific ribonuclease
MRKESDVETRTPPPLPPVQSDTALAIFVHSSLKSSVQNDRFGDAERLAVLGQKVLHMVIAESLFEKRPMSAAVELIVSVPCTVHILLVLN